jgi:hypothetical protein
MDEPDELQYETSVENNTAIMRAINEILFMEKMEKLMPLVTKELIKAGVDFSKVRDDEN